MKVLVTGATGLVGTALCESLVLQGYDIVILSRSASAARQRLGLPGQYFTWARPEEEPPPLEALRGVDALVHLMGQGIVEQRWTKSVKDQLYRSRIQSLEFLAKGFSELGSWPEVAVSASAIGFYGDRANEELNENSTPGAGFLSQLCQDWERSLKVHFGQNSRTVSLRIGIVLAREGGVLHELKKPALSGVLGSIGNGRQWQSWIHREDLVRLIVECLANKKYSGVLNAVSPHPVTNSQLTKEVCRKAQRWVAPSIPKFVLQGLFGEKATVMYSSANVIPQNVLGLGFDFSFPQIEQALDEIYQRPFAENLFVQRQWFPHSSKDLFSFFTDVENLEKITPPFLNFKVEGMNTKEVQKDTLINYRLKIRGLPVRWQSVIYDWSPPAYFVDSQVKGPYKTWHHRHLLIEVKEGTLMKDVVFYELPLSPLSSHFVGSMVDGDVNEIFTYRYEKLEKIWNAPSLDIRV